jgi:hypothetical protein
MPTLASRPQLAIWFEKEAAKTREHALWPSTAAPTVSQIRPRALPLRLTLADGLTHRWFGCCWSCRRGRCEAPGAYIATRPSVRKRTYRRTSPASFGHRPPFGFLIRSAPCPNPNQQDLVFDVILALLRCCKTEPHNPKCIATPA